VILRETCEDVSLSAANFQSVMKEENPGACILRGALKSGDGRLARSIKGFNVQHCGDFVSKTRAVRNCVRRGRIRLNIKEI